MVQMDRMVEKLKSSYAGPVGIDVEVRDEWTEKGRLLRTMTCVATTTSK